MRRFLSLLLCSVLLCISVPVFTGCDSLKPVPIAEGADAIVVNAERAQRSSLDIFQIVTEWEFNNRTVLPAEVSRAVDKFRKEFPPVWQQSREALKAYKDKKGPNATDIDRITAALLVTQESLLTLRRDHNPNQVSQAVNALTHLINSVQGIWGKDKSAQPK